MPRKRTMCPCGCLGTSTQGHYIRGHHPLRERFWAKVDTQGPSLRPGLSPCWIWTASRNDDGYGKLTVDGSTTYAHRIAWTLTYGSIPNELRVLHHCDNPPCVRPDHLFTGTQTQNIADATEKGRMRAPTGDDHWTRSAPALVLKGERHGRAKLTAAIVLEGRRRVAAGTTNAAQYARLHGVAANVMRRAINGQTWRHLEEATHVSPPCRVG